MAERKNDPIPIADERLKAALHSLRVSFAEWQLREFPLFGFDAIKQMGMRGLCTQEEADAAIAEAQAIVWNGHRDRGDLVDAVGFSISTHTDAELFRGTIDDAELFIHAGMQDNLKQAFEFAPPQPAFDTLEGNTVHVYSWDRGVADQAGEMYTCWSPQYQRPCVVAYFNLGDADKIIAHCKHMGAVALEGGDIAFVVVLRPDVGPELYSEEAIRRSAEQFNRERALKLERDEAADGYCGAPASAIVKVKRDGEALLVHKRYDFPDQPKVSPCTECGDATTFACSDCAIDGKPGLHICPNRACMDAHESKCHAATESKS